MARHVRSASVAYRAGTPPIRPGKKPPAPAKPKGRPAPRRPAPPSSDPHAKDPIVTAKLFANGRSQAVRLPKEFRMPGTEVRISREGDRVILEPIGDVPRDANGWPVGFWERLHESTGDLPDDWELPDDPVPPPITPFDEPMR